MLCKGYVLPGEKAFVMLFRSSWIIQLVMLVQSSHFTQLSFSGSSYCLHSILLMNKESREQERLLQINFAPSPSTQYSLARPKNIGLN